nr:response regulator [Lysinibacillus composti]
MKILLKVLIVDDELIVRKGLKALINWEDYDMDVAFEATNGEDAFNIVNNHNIDVLITDIRMPLMDGIELTRKVKESFQQIKVVLLTCYNDFEFVQEALQLGASGYLLKTDLEDGNLEKQLLKISNEIKNERINLESYKKLEINAKKSALLIQENQVSSILNGTPPEEILIDNELKWLNKPFLLIKIKVSQLDCQINSLKEYFNTTFKDELSLTFQLESQALYTIISIPKKTSQMLVLQWQELVINQISPKLKEVSKELSIYYSRCDNIDSLYSKNELLTGNSNRHWFYYGYGAILNIDQLSLNPHPQNSPINIRQLNELTILRNWEKVKKACDENFETYKSICLDPETVKLNVITMVETIMISLQSNSNLFSSSWGKNSIDYKEKVNRILFFKDLKEWFYQGIEDLEQNRVLFMGGMNQVVIQAVSFIETNYFKEITLDDLSAEVGLSQSYLSTIFKKVTGKSFIEYLNDLRIEKAKQLLNTSNLKVFEVANKVGFNDPKYFSKQFKRITGISPNAYKVN